MTSFSGPDAGELTRWFAAFLLTQAVEVPIYLQALRPSALRPSAPAPAAPIPQAPIPQAPGPRAFARRLALAFGASVVTHPFVFLCLPRLWPGSYGGYVAAAEAIAVVAETLWLRHLRVPSPLAWSLAANLSSTAVGWVGRATFGWP